MSPCSVGHRTPRTCWAPSGLAPLWGWGAPWPALTTLPPASAGGCPPALRDLCPGDDSRGSAGISSPSLLFEEVHPGWNGNDPVTCWGRGQAGDRDPCPPALPRAALHQALLHTVPLGTLGGSCHPHPAPVQCFRDGAGAAPEPLVWLCQGGNAAPGASCCFLRTPLLIKSSQLHSCFVSLLGGLRM